ncbi:MAG: pentapeptide repeat-containing protein [candidate division WOR-3 bacterium]
MCKYETEWGWRCPFEPEPGKELCIFHLPLDQKEPKEFYKHLANYLLALYEKNQTPESKKFLEEKKPWILNEKNDKLFDRYKGYVIPGKDWDFIGFVFPAMDDKHNFQEFIFPMDAYFSEAVFHQNANFIGAKFHRNAYFSEAEFQNAFFYRAEFHQNADFSEAKCQNADFSEAVFHQNANFRGAKFHHNANFFGAEFHQDANFIEAEFHQNANFFGAKFHQDANFYEAEFHQDADFIGAEFQNAYFNRAKFKDAYFSGAKFYHNANFSGARFHNANFSRAQFHQDADFSWTEFQNANFSEAEFQNTNFSFAHFKNPPSFRGAEFKEKVDFYEAKIPRLSKKDDERTARYIRLQAEKYGSYADAGDFYIIEMDFRRKRFRKDPKRWFQYILMELYRLVSRYGESPGRGAISLVLALLFFSWIFVISGFNFMNQRVDRDLFPPEISALGPTLKDIGLAFLFALANIIPGNIGGDVMGNELSSAATKVWVIAQVIITYIILALFLLAIRRRFSR